MESDKNEAVKQDTKMAVVGGDARQIYLGKYLIKKGYDVDFYGFDQCEEKINCSKTKEISNTVYQIYILPIQGCSKEGIVRCELGKEDIFLEEIPFEKLPPDTRIFAGKASDFLKKIHSRYGVSIHELLNRDDFAVYNSIPTAEGAISIAMKHTNITLHGAEVFVLGYGRVGTTLARMLQGIGSRVTVFSKESYELARAYETGVRSEKLSCLHNEVDKADIMFNTIPARVVDKEILRRIRRDTLIIDLASSPGGVDVDTAEKMRLKVLKVPGLPGKVAPKTAGEMTGRIILEILEGNNNEFER